MLLLTYVEGRWLLLLAYVEGRWLLLLAYVEGRWLLLLADDEGRLLLFLADDEGRLRDPWPTLIPSMTNTKSTITHPMVIETQSVSIFDGIVSFY